MGLVDTNRKVLEEMLPRALNECDFREWLDDLIDNKEEADAALNDTDLRLEYLQDFLHDKAIDVREDGLVEFWAADRDAEILIGNHPVIVYHHTSSAVLPKIMREGLRSDVKHVNPYENSGAGVYVTTECSGPVIDGYRRVTVNGHGRRGHAICLTIKTTLQRLEPDPDDAHLSSGAHQFILPYVDPKDIIETE